MADRKPPRTRGDERETLLVALQYQRDSFVRKVTGIDDEAARRVLVESGTTLLWLTRHLAFAERIWILNRFSGQPRPTDGVLPDDTIADAIAAYRDTWRTVDAIVAAASLDDPCTIEGETTVVDLRWVLVHLVEETARHAGHADILRELLDGATGR